MFSRVSHHTLQKWAVSGSKAAWSEFGNLSRQTKGGSRQLPKGISAFPPGQQPLLQEKLHLKARGHATGVRGIQEGRGLLELGTGWGKAVDKPKELSGPEQISPTQG